MLTSHKQTMTVRLGNPATFHYRHHKIQLSKTTNKTIVTHSRLPSQTIDTPDEVFFSFELINSLIHLV
jgi:hypothetical protein